MTFDEILFAELKDDPAALGYAPLIAAKNDEGVSALYNAATVAVVGEIERADLATWAASTGMRAVIEDTATSTTSTLRASALGIRDVLSGASTGIDLAKSQNMALLDGWETAGILSADNKASFIALATHNIPRSVSQLGRLATANDIARVVRDASGTQLL